MTTEENLIQRSGNKCELCSSEDLLSTYEVPNSPTNLDEMNKSILLCKVCKSYLADKQIENISHWRCLSDSMWSPEPSVQVMAWRILDSLKNEDWAQNLLDMLYFDDELLAWAQANNTDNDSSLPTKDSNGTTLDAGDSVTLIKDLVVKGANFTAKRGTVVKNISLTSNPKHIEGRVNGTRIVLISAFLKRV